MSGDFSSEGRNSLPVVIQGGKALPALLALSDEAIFSIVEFFKARIHNRHTRRGYAEAARQFLEFMSRRGRGQNLNTILSIDVADWIADMEVRNIAIPTIKQRLAAVRMLFGKLREDGIVGMNPAAGVKGPAYSVSEGKTPILGGDEVRALLDGIDTTTIVGLRDRALIATMAYTFARIGAVLKLTGADVLIQQRRMWLQLLEKRNKGKPTAGAVLRRGLETALVDVL